MDIDYRRVCPECKKNGESSKVHFSCWFTTSAGVSNYYEDGVRHEHDNNESTASWSCSNGHEGRCSSLPSCPVKNCDHRGGFAMWVNPPKPEKVSEPIEKKEITEEKKETSNSENSNNIGVHSIGTAIPTIGNFVYSSYGWTPVNKEITETTEVTEIIELTEKTEIIENADGTKTTKITRTTKTTKTIK